MPDESRPRPVTNESGHSHASGWLPATSGARARRYPPSPRRSLRVSPTPRSPRSSTTSWWTSPTRSPPTRAVRIVTNKSPEALELYRHSTAHLLAAAVTALFPERAVRHRSAHRRRLLLRLRRRAAVRARGPGGHRSEDEGARAQDYVYERQMWPREEAIDFFTKRGEPLKVQLIEEKTAGQPDVSVYTIKDKDTFVDFCVGPHVPSTGKLKAFKLTTTSNAYWKGDAKNAADAARLRHGVLLAEGARRAPARASRKRRSATTASSARARTSSRSIRARRAPASGRRKGTTLYNTLADYMRGTAVPGRLRGSQDAASSTTRRCGSTSGHWAHYRENMFLVEVEPTATR